MPPVWPSPGLLATLRRSVPGPWMRQHQYVTRGFGTLLRSVANNGIPKNHSFFLDGLVQQRTVSVSVFNRATGPQRLWFQAPDA